mgnify:CR=1 FL=1
MTEQADAGLGSRDSGPYVKSLRDVQLPADITSAATSHTTVGEMLDALAGELGGVVGGFADVVQGGERRICGHCGLSVSLCCGGWTIVRYRPSRQSTSQSA